MQIHSFTKTLKRKTKSILLNLIIDIQYIKSKPKQEKVPKRISMYSNKKTKRWRLLAPEYVFDTGRVPFNTLENSNILSWPPRRAPSPALRAAVLQNMLVHCPHMDVLDLQSSPSHLYHLRCEILQQQLRLVRCQRRALGGPPASVGRPRRGLRPWLRPPLLRPSAPWKGRKDGAPIVASAA